MYLKVLARITCILQNENPYSYIATLKKLVDLLGVLYLICVLASIEFEKYLILFILRIM